MASGRRRRPRGGRAARRRNGSTPATTIKATNDQQRGWTYFNLVLTEAGVTLSDATAAALAELHVYHQAFNLWESVPEEVKPALAALRARGFKLVVVSNANGTLHRASIASG